MQDEVKINYDGTYTAETGGWGYVIRDREGRRAVTRSVNLIEA